ncbi:hypothetical protein [Methylocaldum szegediense]|uniref:hypothetical protein n=1 Tax=Methylocaldum szegediense TaxID=73780 RepID=UPI0012EC3B61|nr:hypothetical protein [Methylocaldum szegediense]
MPSSIAVIPAWSAGIQTPRMASLRITIPALSMPAFPTGMTEWNSTNIIDVSTDHFVAIDAVPFVTASYKS